MRETFCSQPMDSLATKTLPRIPLAQVYLKIDSRLGNARLLWPVKQSDRRRHSWADVMVFTENIDLDSKGLETFGIAWAGRCFGVMEKKLSGFG